MEPIQKDLSFEVIHRDPVILVAPYRKEKEQNEPFSVEGEILKQYRVLTKNYPAYWSKL
jgi:hypothetical protein